MKKWTCPQCNRTYPVNDPSRAYCACVAAREANPRRRIRGIGDLIEHAIKWLTRGRLKPCRPCQQRRDRLNRWWRFR